ncbi:MAG: M3 family metallopeptidase [Melioribacteraceae bacterium]|nr:M3 family metallopeptidase [Melioribacteraceae bacterium]MCF8263549.1 M3 family metallopeptidase [Melioribacteraceae bacterium]MCF8430675.1 M3 family metallopeptidase [Melioribacteraceae bacterium]
MKRFFMLIFSGALLFSGCSKEVENPLLAKWDTPFQTPPFNLINESHYIPAFKVALQKHKEEIKTIVENEAEPTFENTVVALDNSGELLKRVNKVFSAMNESMSTEKMQEINKEVTPMLSGHKDDINLNPGLFQRVKSVYENRESENLNTEQARLLDHYYKKFVRGGANLSDADKDKFRKINDEISLLKVQFGENVLKENNRFELVITDQADLAGLPDGVVSSAAEAAKEAGYEDSWLFTISKPSMLPFITYSENRDLREKIYTAYVMKGNNGNELDNNKNASKLAALRVKKANLLGYKTFAHFVLEENMAGEPENVYELLNKLWDPALERAKSEREEMQKMIYAEGNDFELESWDWWYYSEKVKKAKYDLDEDELRPYFSVENAIEGVFGLATDLWGIQFVERTDIQKYHPDVKVFEVKEEDGSHIGILYTDYFPRASKRAGAWMDEFRRQHKVDGKMITPIIYNVGNFSKPTGNKPALLSLDEVLTLFHEFGHALHGLLSDCTYESLAATETPRDFVEFPSQVMENWAMHPDVLKNYAKHYETGEVIPADLIKKIQNASQFNQGFATVEYLAASYLDLDWHTLSDPTEKNAAEFEKASMTKIGLIDEIFPRYRTTYFNHIFSGGYSAGYYSYIWSEVLDADAFNAFVQSGDVLNPELASKYRKYILSSGGTDDAMELYKKFRGAEPEIEPLLKRRGLN